MPIHHDVPLTVMTYNLYIGSNAETAIGAESLLQLSKISADLYDDVMASDFQQRAEAIAMIVKSHSPHLIGLQEVALIRRQSLSDWLSNMRPNAEDVHVDYLGIFMKALYEEGLRYRIAAISSNIDIEMPMFTDNNIMDVRFTDHDVILARSDVIVSRPTSMNYTTRLAIGHLGIDITRGYAAVDAFIHDVTYRVVNTHLEAIDSGARIAQAQELAESLHAEALPIILLGDFNSRAPEGAAYQLLLAAGYRDAWQSESDGPGATCCQSGDLINKTSELSNRIDQVFVKASNLHSIGALRTFTVGDNPSDRLPSGLWPSDHAGVVAHLTVD